MRIVPGFGTPANLDVQDVYDQLETKVKEMIASGTLDEKRQIAYQSFLFIIMYVLMIPLGDVRTKSDVDL